MIRPAPAPLFALLALLVPAAAPGLAHADAKAEAQARMDRATQLYEERNYAEALNELTVAYTLDPRPEMLYAIGQMHVQLGNCPQAILFYERFLSTRPEPVPAAAATEAIETCRKAPDSVLASPAPPEPPAGPATAPRPPPEAPPAPRRWYADPLGGGLLAGGAALGVAGMVLYLSARGDLDEADAAIDYRTHAELVDGAHGKRTIAAVIGAVGVGLAGAAVARYVLVRRAGERAAAIAVAPSPGGGLVTWSGRF